MVIVKIRDAIDKGGGQSCNVEGVLAALREAGFAIVPVDPTPDMLEAGAKIVGLSGQPHVLAQIWYAFLNAAGAKK